VNRYLLSIAICCAIPGAGHAAFAAAGQAAGVAEINAAIELGRLNVAQTAPERAASNSAVGAIVTYENQMNAALARSDQGERDAAITAARRQLALAGNKQLTPAAVTRIDALLGINGASPALGTTP